MNDLQRLRDRLTVGTTLVCVENTYIPGQAGGTRSINRVSRAFARATEGNGRHVSMKLPTRARDIEWLDDDTVRWVLDLELAHLTGHTVTYRFTGSEN